MIVLTHGLEWGNLPQKYLAEKSYSHLSRQGAEIVDKKGEEYTYAKDRPV